jgi:hypothetical protein
MSRDNRFDLRWATPGDEPEIRALVGSVPMPGSVSLRFAREPDYFLGTTIMGDPCDVLVIRHRPDGQLAAIACRAQRRAYLNGKEAPLGYIGQIRVAPGFQGRWLVQRGAKWLRETSPSGQLYLGAIASENPRARKLLAGARLPAGLHARRICGLTTCAILLRPRRTPGLSGIDIRPGSPETLEEIVDFFREQGARRQFFPVYTLESFTGGTQLRGLRPQDLMVARRGNTIAGVMAAWDQEAYKQDIVHAYGPGLHRIRPIYDLLARLVGAQPLTPPGKAIPLAFAACICIENDDKTVMRALLSACMEHAYGLGKAFLMLGLPDDDPLLTVARRQLHIPYRSELFGFSWSEEPALNLDRRMPYIEIATL